MGMRILDRLSARVRPSETQAPAVPTSDVEIGPLPDPDVISLADHRRIVEDALLDRDKAWLIKLRFVEASVLWPWRGPVTTLISATERQIVVETRKREMERNLALLEAGQKA